tara:strand:- start:412 stop:1428 length:1017 start_codon:yes stop_codon:yes gene_type:complete
MRLSTNLTKFADDVYRELPVLPEGAYAGRPGPVSEARLQSLLETAANMDAPNAPPINQLKRMQAMEDTGDLEDARRRYDNARKMLAREKTYLRSILEGAGTGALVGSAAGLGAGSGIYRNMVDQPIIPFFNRGGLLGLAGGGLAGAGIGGIAGLLNKFVHGSRSALTKDEIEQERSRSAPRQLKKKEKRVVKKLQEMIDKDPEVLEKGPSDEIVKYLMQEGLLKASGKKEDEARKKESMRLATNLNNFVEKRSEITLQDIKEIEDNLPNPLVEALKSALLSGGLSAGGTALINRGVSPVTGYAALAGGGLGALLGGLGQYMDNQDVRSQLQAAMAQQG